MVTRNTDTCLPRLHEECEIWGEGEVMSTTTVAAAGRGPSQGGRTQGVTGDGRARDEGFRNVAGVFAFQRLVEDQKVESTRRRGQTRDKRWSIRLKLMARLAHLP